MHTIHPPPSQYHVHSRPLPPPSNAAPSPSPRPTPTQQPHQNAREPVTVVAVPSVTVEYNQLIVGDARSSQSNVLPLSPSLNPQLAPFLTLFSLALSFSSIDAHIHPPQGCRRWIVRNRVAV